MVRELFMVCGKHARSHINLNRLADLGKALDTSQILSVFAGGFVGLSDEDESEVIQHVAGKEGRSPARPRSGQRTAEGPWWPSGETHYFGSDAHEEAFGVGFRVLAQHYEALAFEENDGLWVVVKSEPLGCRGPQIHFLIAFPLRHESKPKGWAFDRIGAQVSPMSLKHTNFPDASICAFLHDEYEWSQAGGMIELVDHYTIWAVKKLHRDYMGHWPGMQVGACAFYRRLEFTPNEQCGCLSGKKYKICHQGADMLVSEQAGREEFQRLFRSDYHSRAVPKSIVDAARSRWRKLPPLKSVLGFV